MRVRGSEEDGVKARVRVRIRVRIRVLKLENIV